jgi:hypothetical protein
MSPLSPHPMSSGPASVLEPSLERQGLSGRVRVAAALAVLAVAGLASSGGLHAQGTGTPPVVFSEIHYHPPNKTKLEEFIELHNAGPVAVSLDGWRVEDGVELVFAPGTSIPPGGYVVVAENLDAFRARFGFTPFGPWTGKLRNQGAFLLRYGTGKTIAGSYAPDHLSNGGEHVKLSYGAGTPIHELTYGTVAPWPTRADGGGCCLQLIAPESRPKHALAENWRAGIGWASWAAAHGGITNLLADADGDGLNTLMEYALDSDPAAPSK